ncbi:phosphate ABC transporter substrate-binding protein [Halomonas sp. MCCC 1A17488]|uniref:Phosphate ABC transporter substrate-binding protein n=1 Tax=Billgrantia sulfidoxydans TaxID=2733484 RepID=A0ABX7W967_9GAMM|nr:MULTISPECIES: phosphate ABC transporter substrate-binding protein [Halomonas]MCE8017309.1 phosphate ABC transporter substrate-binding protein [Halomonas sp. MCCC 1A17488]MCG3240642.1 phosphate ABC transporter substrate-binding protein [Halomonas sp. MCCC 1A17488]QPP49513.1 phosphate ABC transporter substrate-binding protein [Halomonas sp. SS10-MC5]QTP56868.1 phosphate ABC transporter substrate-binding protein [Halomonas sulfidoxydans]
MIPIGRRPGRCKLRHGCLTVLLALLAAMAQADEPPVGTLGVVGSDTMAGLMLRWGEQLGERHPGIRLQLQASGSASAPPALAAGTTRLGPMSRPMDEEERRAFVQRHGYAPVEVEVARDALAIIVHRHHALESLRLTEVDAIFSRTRRCGGERDITRWQQLGIDDRAGRIELHGRNPASGSHGFFRQHALCAGQYRQRLNEHPGSAAVAAAVTESRRAIGYVGLNHLTPGVKALALEDHEGTRRLPDAEQVRRGGYPLSRSLYLYANLPPGEALSGPERALLELILSPEGQQTVSELGFVALSEAALASQRERLGLDAPPP